jgi:hypothetical protein
MDNQLMVTIWVVPYHVFQMSVLTNDMMKQVMIDLPRMHVSINNVRADNISEVKCHLGDGCMSKAVLPFLCQTSMALPVCKMHDMYQCVLDGGGPLNISVGIVQDEYTIDIDKDMCLVDGSKLMCNVHIASTCCDVFITCCESWS